MKKLSIFAILFLIVTPLAITAVNVSGITLPDGFSFHPGMTTGTELKWELKKNDFKPAIGETIPIYIMSGVEWEKGQVFSIKLTEDLNSLVGVDPEDIFDNGTWGEFYLDGSLISTDPSEILFYSYESGIADNSSDDVSTGVFPYINPLYYIYGSTNESYFQLLYDTLKATEFVTDEEGLHAELTVELTDDRLTISNILELELTDEYYLDSTMSASVLAQIVLNRNDGVLHEFKVELDMKISAPGISVKASYDVLIQCISSPEKLGYEWITGFVALFGVGLVYIAMRKRK